MLGRASSFRGKHTHLDEEEGEEEEEGRQGKRRGREPPTAPALVRGVHAQQVRASLPPTGAISLA